MFLEISYAFYLGSFYDKVIDFLEYFKWIQFMCYIWKELALILQAFCMYMNIEDACLS